MKDNIQPLKIISQGGLNSNQNFLEMSQQMPGMATRLVNFETSLFGGYRRINGFRPLDQDYEIVDEAGAEGKILGVYAFRNEGNQTDETLAARKAQGSNTYKIYKYTSGVGWGAYTTGTTQSSIGVNRLRFSLLNDGSINHVCMVDGINNALIYDGTNWYQINSSNSGSAMSPGGDQCLDAPKFTAVFKNYLFTAQNGIVAHSAPFDPLNWESSAGGGQIPVGFTIVQIYPWRDELYVFGLNTIKKIIPDPSVGGSFLLQDVTANIGCIASDSVQEIASNLIFLSPDGIRPVAGTERMSDVELSLISEDIQSLVKQYTDANNPDDITSTVVKQKTQFRYFFSNGNTDVNKSKGILGCYSVMRNDKGWEFGELYGIRTSCCWSGYLSGVEFILHGDHNGGVYRQEQGRTFNNEDILGVYTTPYFDMDAPSIRKTPFKLYTFLRCEGPLEMSIAVRYDWARTSTINPTNYNEEPGSDPVQYGAPEAIYGNPGVVYGSPTQPVIETNIQGSGKSVQISFVSTGDWSPYTIQGFVIEFMPEGRQ